MGEWVRALSRIESCLLLDPHPVAPRARGVPRLGAAHDLGQHRAAMLAPAGQNRIIGPAPHAREPNGASSAKMAIDKTARRAFVAIAMTAGRSGPKVNAGLATSKTPVDRDRRRAYAAPSQRRDPRTATLDQSLVTPRRHVEPATLRATNVLKFVSVVKVSAQIDLRTLVVASSAVARRVPLAPLAVVPGEVKEARSPSTPERDRAVARPRPPDVVPGRGPMPAALETSRPKRSSARRLTRIRATRAGVASRERVRQI
jgi:hypothetical protein